MPKRVEKLIVKDFRGATAPLEIDFDKSKPMAMIFGENGTGKSSIVDAFDFVCNQQYGSIEGRSSVKKKAHLPTLGKFKNDILVTLQFNNEKWIASHQGSEPITSPAGFPSANILRRSSILKLIDSAPKKRYQELSEFLAVPNIEKCENTLRDAIRNQEREYSESTSAVTQAKDELENLQNELKENDKSVEEWSKEVTEIKEDELKAIIKNAKEVEDLQGKYNTAKKKLADAKKSLNGLQVAETKAVDDLNKFQERESSKEDLQKLLNTAKEYLAQNSDINICPVCEQKIIQTDVLGRITQRLEDMTTLTELMKSVESAKANKRKGQELVDIRAADYNNSVSVLILKIKANKADIVEKDENQINYDKLISELITTDSKDVENAKNELEKYEKYKTSLEEQRKEAEKKQKQQAAVKTLLASIKKKEIKSKEDAIILTRLKKYEEIVPAIRKKYTDDILQKVATEVERLYQTIHPKEGLGGIHLYLKPNVKGSLEYDTVFQGEKGIPPQAYYSDAHLDTLGICMFLALAKHFNDDNTIIILDDVVTSADEAHRERFLNMLHDEAENFCHLVVTTHYRPWRDFYRIGGGPSNKVQFIDLQLWSKTAGIRHYNSKLIIDELRSLTENITIENRQNIASKSGILLEGVLDQLILKYSLKVPRRPLQRFELGILFDSLSKHKKHLKTIQHYENGTSDKETEIKPLIEKLENTIFIRNQVGSHWNIDGSLLSDSDVKEFAENTIILCEALTCDVCGNLPLRNKTGNFLQCQCGKLEMYPLQMP